MAMKGGYQVLDLARPDTIIAEVIRGSGGKRIVVSGATLNGKIIPDITTAFAEQESGKYTGNFLYNGKLYTMDETSAITEAEIGGGSAGATFNSKYHGYSVKVRDGFSVLASLSNDKTTINVNGAFASIGPAINAGTRKACSIVSANIRVAFRLDITPSSGFAYEEYVDVVCPMTIGADPTIGNGVILTWDEFLRGMRGGGTSDTIMVRTHGSLYIEGNQLKDSAFEATIENADLGVFTDADSATINLELTAASLQTLEVG